MKISEYLENRIKNIWKNVSISDSEEILNTYLVSANIDNEKYFQYKYYYENRKVIDRIITKKRIALDNFFEEKARSIIAIAKLAKQNGNIEKYNQYLQKLKELKQYYAKKITEINSIKNIISKTDIQNITEQELQELQEYIKNIA